MATRPEIAWNIPIMISRIEANMVQPTAASL